MAEVSNQRVIDRYKDLLANRTHDVIVRDAAIEMLEAELQKVKEDLNRLLEENRNLSNQLSDTRGELLLHTLSPKEDPDSDSWKGE